MASRGVNKVIIVGNLGQDPEVRYMPNGTAVANFTVATSESWKDKQTGEQKEQTEWHRITMYRRLAEIAGEYLRKGAKVYIEGRLQTRKWQDQQGQDRYTTEIVANEMQMLDSRTGGGQSAGAGNFQPGQGGYQQSQSPQQGGYQQSQPQQQGSYQPPQQQSYQPPHQSGFQPHPQGAPTGAPGNMGGAQRPGTQPPKQQPPMGGEPPLDFDDDIPF